MIEGVTRNLFQGVDFRRSRHVVTLRGGVEGIGSIRIRIVDGLKGSLATQVFTNSDKFHLGSDDSLPRIPELGHRVVAGAERSPLEARILLQLVAGFPVFVELAGMLL